MNLSNAVGDAVEQALSFSSNRISRREFLMRSSAIGLGAALAPPMLKAATSPYRVGVGHNTDPYAATQRALQASGEFPNVAGKVVVIKPNLVKATTADTGIVTDPQVVRAVVDQALAASASAVLIVEAAGLTQIPANFSAAGYGFFNTYDPLNRVRLVDLGTQPVSLVNVPHGWIFNSIYAAPLPLRRDFVFVNVAKLKTHADALVTLTTKNVFGLPYPNIYVDPTISVGGRFAIHDRGLNQAIIDLNSLRPSDFAIIDGVIGLQGNGPTAGTPVEMDLVLAGPNTVAVDRVGMFAMGVAQNAVRYINYASLFGMGPSDLSQITVSGDSFTAGSFLLPQIPPNFDPPVPSPASFSPGSGQATSIQINYYTSVCTRTVNILQISDTSPATATLIQTLLPSSTRTAGVETVQWDGRAQDGTIAPPGRYGIHVRAQNLSGNLAFADATSWVTVTS
jgi:uncharacterized protein (DUF362 family)